MTKSCEATCEINETRQLESNASIGKPLPKNFSDSLVKKLNRMCLGGDGCSVTCSGIGWCEDCWGRVRVPKA